MKNYMTWPRSATTAIVAVFAVLGIFLLDCSVHTPEVKITGEKTALENQILGTYSQVKEDVWMIASVRSTNPDSQITVSEDKRAVLTAIQNREFNKDDIDEFKRSGVVGENLRGLLEIRPNEQFENDPQYRKLVEEIVGEENQDRETIMRRIIDINPSIQSADQAKVENVFAKLNRESANPGEWIQLPDGQWFKKEKSN